MNATPLSMPASPPVSPQSRRQRHGDFLPSLISSIIPGVPMRRLLPIVCTPNTVAALCDMPVRRPGARAILGACMFLSLVTTVHAAPLNDTGVTHCGNTSQGNSVQCTGAVPADQDAHHGRDAEFAAGSLQKIGGGVAGFDFTALDATGHQTTPTTGANPHPCVRDNTTGLIWEVKTDDSGLRDKDWTYTWYDSNYGGTPAGSFWATTNCKNTSRCDTEKYVAEVNATALCGYTDWRMPTRQELISILHLGIDPLVGDYGPTCIDTTYFPNTAKSPQGQNKYWSSWVTYVDFDGGYSGSAETKSEGFIRLVRGGM